MPFKLHALSPICCVFHQLQFSMVLESIFKNCNKTHYNYTLDVLQHNATTKKFGMEKKSMYVEARSHFEGILPATDKQNLRKHLPFSEKGDIDWRHYSRRRIVCESHNQIYKCSTSKS